MDDDERYCFLKEMAPSLPMNKLIMLIGVLAILPGMEQHTGYILYIVYLFIVIVERF